MSISDLVRVISSSSIIVGLHKNKSCDTAQLLLNKLENNTEKIILELYQFACVRMPKDYIVDQTLTKRMPHMIEMVSYSHSVRFMRVKNDSRDTAYLILEGKIFLIKSFNPNNFKEYLFLKKLYKTLEREIEK